MRYDKEIFIVRSKADNNQLDHRSDNWSRLLNNSGTVVHSLVSLPLTSII